MGKYKQRSIKIYESYSKKVKVQKYGIYSAKRYLFVVDEFDDIKEGLERSAIWKDLQDDLCRDSEVWCENWDMDDVLYVLYPALERLISRNFFYAALKNLIDLGVIECVNPD